PEGRRLQLIIGAEFRCSEGLQLELLAPEQRAYSELCRLITRSRRRADKGRYALTRSDLETGLAHCLALWRPALDGALAPERASVEGRWLRERFPERTWLAVELHRGAGDRARLAHALEL